MFSEDQDTLMNENQMNEFIDHDLNAIFKNQKTQQEIRDEHINAVKSSNEVSSSSQYIRRDLMSLLRTTQRPFAGNYCFFQVLLTKLFKVLFKA